MIEQGEMLVLENNNKKFSVVYSTMLDSTNYVYLIDQDDYTNTMFGTIVNGELVEVTDSNIIEQLLKKFAQENSNK